MDVRLSDPFGKLVMVASLTSGLAQMCGYQPTL